MPTPIRLYRSPLSGHSHRVQLQLALQGLPAELIDVDLRAGAHKRPEFLAKNPLGQVPVIEDGALTLADSNAILVYLAQQYDPSARWLPRSAVAQGRIQRWLSIAANELFQGPCTARLCHVFGAQADLPRAQRMAAELFRVFEQQLSKELFFAASEPTLADVALYTYTAHAPEGGVPIAPYPALCAWLARMEQLPGFVPMARSPLPA
jgi:glutathione S-transferase